MKIPNTPPSWRDLFDRIAANPGRFPEVMSHGVGPTIEGKYRHWDILRHLNPPDGLSSEEWWLALKLARTPLYQTLPLRDRNGGAFRYALPGAALRLLHEIDRDATGRIGAAGKMAGTQTGVAYLIRSLVEEPIASSQLEGAATTRDVAKDMIRQGRQPRTPGERMILNNHLAMQFIRQAKGEQLTPAFVLEIHRVLTHDTFDNPEASGRYRHPNLPDEEICVVDETGNILHRPPHASELPARMQALCDFANAIDDEPFVHPVIRAIVLHLWLAYDHPFVDGNGRTARALFYWSMASQGYWLMEYVAISRILKGAPGKYARAFLYTETDENDATYFILNQLGVVRRAINDLHGYLERKVAETRDTERLIRNSPVLRARLNHRQLALLTHALSHGGAGYTIASHRGSHAVTYQTARTDLLGLAELGFLEQGKVGQAFVFHAPGDLRDRLKHMAHK
jgi:Fic family protein